MRYCFKDRHGQTSKGRSTDRLEDMEVDLNSYGHSIFNKDAKIYKWSNDGLFNIKC